MQNSDGMTIRMDISSNIIEISYPYVECGYSKTAVNTANVSSFVPVFIWSSLGSVPLLTAREINSASVIQIIKILFCCAWHTLFEYKLYTDILS